MPGETAPEISTPDRRVRVFVSSTLQELADERQAVRTAITRLRLTPVMFELGARPHPPRELYRAYLAQSDVFVGIYWRRYGWVAPGEAVSGLEDEYLLSGDRPKLIYVKSAADREPRLTELLDRVQDDDRAAYKPFDDSAELADLVADDLAVLLTERFTRPVRAAPQGLRTARLPVPPTAIVGREGEAAAVGALPRRQRTLRATVEWSHSLLGPAEQALLARLSVFAGAWTLEGAEAVGAGGAADAAAGHFDVLDTMSSLVAQSLVSADERAVDEPRFRMLDTVRAYARERLAERGERVATLRRLSGYLCAFAAEAGPRLEGPDNREWTSRVDDELDDLRSTTRWAVSADEAQVAIRMTAPLFTYWWSRGLLPQQSEAAEQVAALPSASRLPPGEAARLLWARGMFRIARGDLAGAEPLLRRLVEATAELGDVRLRAHALAGLGLATSSEATEEARGLLDDAVATFRRIGDRWGLAFALSTRGQVALQHGDAAGAAALHREGLAAAELIGNDFLRAQALDLLGLDAIAVGDLPEARSRFAAAAEVHGELLDQEGSAYRLGGFAAVAFAQGRAEPAARLIGTAKHAREVVGAAVWPGMRPLVQAMDAAVQAAVGDAAYAAALAEGARMRLPEALRYAREATE